MRAPSLAQTTHDTIVVVLHQGFSRVVLIYSLLLALWGLFLYLRGANPSGSYLGALILDMGVVTLQGIIGIVLYAQGTHRAQFLHILYGVAAFLTLPSAYFYSDGGTTRRDSLVFGLATLLLFGLGIRAIMTAPT